MKVDGRWLNDWLLCLWFTVCVAGFSLIVDVDVDKI